ncbi:MAG: pyruvate kinase [Alphaproteobacteria bacterium]|nr:pyruvate kinase [Alphaproteobacteria bacterium]
MSVQQIHWSRRTKIIATLGPASQDKKTISALFEAGVDIFRLNFSHGTHEYHKAAFDKIRSLEKKTGRPIGIMADLQGPKLRIGEFEAGEILLTEGQSFRFDLDTALGNEQRVNLPHPEIIDILEKDSLLFLDDGNVRARVILKGKDFVEVEIRAGKKLSNRKGLNVPEVIIPIPALSNKDRVDLNAALEMGVDWIAQSFVQTADDVKEAKKLINGRASLMVKLEKPSALQQLDEIIEQADGIMIARGDLGVEIPPEHVPAVQKNVIRKVRENGKPVIVATQMLESMIENSRPTRAEASDVATAVYDGADGIMLSAETAIGDYPIKAVTIMDRICRRTEEDDIYEQMMDNVRPEAAFDPSDAITTAAYYVSQDIGASFIVTYTMSGSTAMRMARQRPNVPILCLTPNISVARSLSISYGVHAVHVTENVGDFTGPARSAAKIALEHKIAESGQTFVMTAGVPFGETGSTNTLRIATVD